MASVFGWIVLLCIFASFACSLHAYFFRWKQHKFEAEEVLLDRRGYALRVGFSHLWIWILEAALYMQMKKAIQKLRKEGFTDQETAGMLGLSCSEIESRLNMSPADWSDIEDIFSPYYNE